MAQSFELFCQRTEKDGDVEGMGCCWYQISQAGSRQRREVSPSWDWYQMWVYQDLCAPCCLCFFYDEMYPVYFDG